MTFEWDEKKNQENICKHGIAFDVAQYAFADKNRLIQLDTAHSDEHEKRYFCYGKVEDKIVTVRFTVRNNVIRIFGSGYWRKGKKRYEKEDRIL